MTGEAEAAAPTGTLRAVIFDMDGVLIDTEPVWRDVEVAVFASLGLTLTDAECRESMGTRVGDAVQSWLASRPPTGQSAAHVTERIVAGVIDHVRDHGEPIDGALAAVSTVRDAGLRCAVASSSPPALIAAALARLGIAADVDVTCSAEQEAQGKPAPDVYLRAASLLELPPAECLAIEDSINGVLSARAAGMACVAVPDTLTGADPRLSAATVRLTSLRDLDRACLDALRADYFP